MEQPCNEHERKLAALETTVKSHGVEISGLRDKAHNNGNAITVLSATLARLEKNNDAAADRFDRHIEHDEATLSKLYERLKSMDDELKASFGRRDTKQAEKTAEIEKEIHRIDKAQVKILAYATGAFAVVTFAIQIGLHTVFGI